LWLAVIDFDLDDRYQGENVVGSAIPRREGIFLSVVFHGLLLALLVYAPEIPFLQFTPEDVERRRAEIQQPREDEQDRTFVFVQPRIDMPVEQPPERPELSDQDRLAQAPEVPMLPENPLPFSLGDSPERVDAELAELARGAEEPLEQAPEPESELARALPPSDSGFRPPTEFPPPASATGSLGEALRDLQRYVQNETFDNPRGGNDRPGATIQFDTKGVEFGPWLRRFVAQVRRNWFVPQAASVLSGHVVLQFNIHRDGAITDIVVLQPSSIDAFNNAAYGAIATSNPTAPLPPEYPSEQALFTVTFYYNEEPPY
jgi:TonB family protein